LSEMQAIEIRFPGEQQRVGSYVDGVWTTWSLFRTPEDGHRVHGDDGTLTWIEQGRNGEGARGIEVWSGLTNRSRNARGRRAAARRQARLAG
jgi:hypothetical protein